MCDRAPSGVSMKVWIVSSGCRHCESVEIDSVLDYEPSVEQLQQWRERARASCRSAGAWVEEQEVLTRET